jgi:asparagine synthase (glutamine-hydrolysing)
MCGIGGGFGGLGGAAGERTAAAIIREIRSRGPDGDGVEMHDDGFLAHLRLAIIDRSEGGRQPMRSADGRLSVTYNGEIYNYRELRRELEEAGRRFRSDSDTEVLIQAWEEWGPDCVERFVGMFAFGMLDVPAGRLHLVRDAYGIKPLYVLETERGVRFASTMRAMFAFPDCPRRPDPERAFMFLRYGVVDDRTRTLVEGVRPVEPGTTEVFDVARPRPALVGRRAWWRPEYRAEPDPPSFEDAADRLRALILDSVRLHMRSDVPIGFSLSGGLDSATLVCAARAVEPDADLRTFTYCAEGSPLNEEALAASVAGHVGARFHRCLLPPIDLAAMAEDDAREHGTPSLTISGMGQVAVFRAAREAGVTVLLDGQGADETLGGYAHHVGAALAGRVRAGRLGEALRFLRGAAGNPRLGWRWPAAFAAQYALPPALASAGRRVVGREGTPAWISRAAVAGLDLEALAAARHPPAGGGDVLGARLAHDLTEAVIPDLLRLEDLHAMSWSVENRVPFLNPAITRFAYSLPSDYHIGPDGVTKRLLRHAIRGLVPDAIRERRIKIGLEVPQGDLADRDAAAVERELAGDVARSIGMFDHDALMETWRRRGSGDAASVRFVWRWLGLIAWTRVYGIDWSAVPGAASARRGRAAAASIAAT